MKNFLSLIIIAFLGTLSLNSFAGNAGWSGEATITSIYALHDDAVLIKLSSFKNPGGCSTNSSGHIMVSPNSEKTWFTLLLSAYMAGKTVDIYVTSDCTPYWANTGFAEIGHVVVKN
jgi:hypothetical protein